MKLESSLLLGIQLAILLSHAWNPINHIIYFNMLFYNFCSGKLVLCLAQTSDTTSFQCFIISQFITEWPPRYVVSHNISEFIYIILKCVYHFQSFLKKKDLTPSLVSPLHKTCIFPYKCPKGLKKNVFKGLFIRFQVKWADRSLTLNSSLFGFLIFWC